MVTTKEEIMEIITQQAPNWVPSGDICAHTSVTYDTTMKHLKELVDRGLLDIKREGETKRLQGTPWVCWYRLPQPEPKDPQLKIGDFDK